MHSLLSDGDIEAVQNTLTYHVSCLPMFLVKVHVS